MAIDDDAYLSSLMAEHTDSLLPSTMMSFTGLLEEGEDGGGNELDADELNGKHNNM